MSGSPNPPSGSRRIFLLLGFAVLVAIAIFAYHRTSRATAPPPAASAQEPPTDSAQLVAEIERLAAKGITETQRAQAERLWLQLQQRADGPERIAEMLKVATAEVAESGRALRDGWKKAREAQVFDLERLRQSQRYEQSIAILEEVSAAAQERARRAASYTEDLAARLNDRGMPDAIAKPILEGVTKSFAAAREIEMAEVSRQTAEAAREALETLKAHAAEWTIDPKQPNGIVGFAESVPAQAREAFDAAWARLNVSFRKLQAMEEQFRAAAAGS